MFTKTKTRWLTTAIGVAFVALGLVFSLTHMASAENNSDEGSPGLTDWEWFKFVCENGGGKASKATDLVYRCDYPDGSTIICDKWMSDCRVVTKGTPEPDDAPPATVGDLDAADVADDPNGTAVDPGPSAPDADTIEPQPLSPDTADDEPEEPGALDRMPTVGEIGTRDATQDSTTTTPGDAETAPTPEPRVDKQTIDGVTQLSVDASST